MIKNIEIIITIYQIIINNFLIQKNKMIEGRKIFFTALKKRISTPENLWCQNSRPIFFIFFDLQ